jgi:hypothetical protein
MMLKWPLASRASTEFLASIPDTAYCTTYFVLAVTFRPSLGLPAPGCSICPSLVSPFGYFCCMLVTGCCKCKLLEFCTGGPWVNFRVSLEAILKLPLASRASTVFLVSVPVAAYCTKYFVLAVTLGASLGLPALGCSISCSVASPFASFL